MQSNPLLSGVICRLGVLELVRVGRKYIHEVVGDPMGTAGHRLELDSIQVDVVRQAKLDHVTCHTQNNTQREGKLKQGFTSQNSTKLLSLHVSHVTRRGQHSKKWLTVKAH